LFITGDKMAKDVIPIICKNFLLFIKVSLSVIQFGVQLLK